MDDLSSSKWRNRARLELWASDNQGSLRFVCDDYGRWLVTATVPNTPGTWIVSSGPHESVEEACAAVIERFRRAGHEVPDAPGVRLLPND